MQGHWASFGIGIVTGLRSMTASAALSWGASLGRTRVRWIPSGSETRRFATAAALAEVAGDRRILPSFTARLTIGAVGGAALARRDASPPSGALAGITEAVAGTLLGHAVRGATTRSGADWARGLMQDAVAAGLATALICLAERRSRA